MKRIYLITLLLALCSLTMHAQDSFFNRFADMEGVTSVFISKAMLSLMPDVKAEGVEIGKIASRLDHIQILSSEKKSVAALMRKEAAFINTKNGYEELMRVNDEGDKVSVFLKQQNDGKKEFVMLNDEKDEFTIILIVGNLTAEDIRDIINH